jgi:hypothetical protein
MGNTKCGLADNRCEMGNKRSQLDDKKCGLVADSCGLIIIDMDWAMRRIIIEADGIGGLWIGLQRRWLKHCRCSSQKHACSACSDKAIAEHIMLICVVLHVEPNLQGCFAQLRRTPVSFRVIVAAQSVQTPPNALSHCRLVQTKVRLSAFWQLLHRTKILALFDSSTKDSYEVRKAGPQEHLTGAKSPPIEVPGQTARQRFFRMKIKVRTPRQGPLTNRV